jgi:predicted O-methyltransferase YrrM
MTPHVLVEMLTDDLAYDMAQHLLVLYSIARFLPAKTSIEIGCDDGSSTLPLLLGGGIVHSVDIAPCEEADRRVREAGLRPRWGFHQMPSVEFAKQLADDSVDLVLIDGDHSEAAAWVDWNAYKSKVRVGGIILFHDTMSPHFPGVARVIDQCVKPDANFEYACLPYGWGLGIARRIA